MANSNFSGAAVLLRATLDEMPNWQRARLAFARALARMGREPSARRELRQAQVTPVPPVGGTVEIAFAPNSNVDRASAATLLSPEIQPFSLTRSAPVFSGSGLRISSQLYGYLPVTSRILATVKLTLNNHLYPTASYLVGANALTWHEFGKSTVFATFAVQHLMADGTLAPTKTVREDWLLRGGCGVALRKFTVFGFVPSIRASYTRNLSSIVSQPYSNPGGEFSLNHAF